MRSIKELLETLLHEYENNKDDTIRWTGLCSAILTLRTFDLITEGEKKVLEGHIKENRPDWSRLKHYWWPKGEVEPRVEFLNKLISEL